MDKELVTFADVAAAWKVFNRLPHPTSGSFGRFFQARDKAWDNYTKIRDRYLVSVGLLELPRQTYVWHRSNGVTQ